MSPYFERQVDPASPSVRTRVQSFRQNVGQKQPFLFGELIKTRIRKGLGIFLRQLSSFAL